MEFGVDVGNEDRVELEEVINNFLDVCVYSTHLISRNSVEDLIF
jgi:hypothetical protein